MLRRFAAQTRVASLSWIARDFAERDLWNIDSGSASLRLDVEGPDHLAPPLGFVGNEFPELGR